jgi:ATP-dependent DNA helicase RecQ
MGLVGDDAKGVSIQTYHGLSLRLTGHAITTDQLTIENTNKKFSDLISEATLLLQGDKALLGIEVDETRDRLLAGFRFILVDEYQDIDEQQYQLVSAIAGRTLDEDSKLSILAVGDDDQNIYQFRGANVGFIRRFQEDYQAKDNFLVENYRSSAHIISAANQLIEHNRDRMKRKHPIRINQGRKNLEAGGRWQKLDTISRGRVQIISAKNEQAQAFAAVEELLRLKQLDARLDWTQCAILAKEWKLLSPIRTELETHNIPLSLMLPADRQPPPFRIREIANFLDTVRNWAKPTGKASEWLEYLDNTHAKNRFNIWIAQLKEILQDWQRETDDGVVSTRQTLEFLYETLAEQRREQRLGQGVFLGTIHSVKGLEFTHLWVLDGGWTSHSMEEQRRLFYVAMTRAKETLCLMNREDKQNPFLNEIRGDHVLHRQVAVRKHQDNSSCSRQYAILGLQDFVMSYAAGFAATQPIHQHLANLYPGSTLDIENNNGKCVITYRKVIIAVLSKRGNQQWLPLIKSI